MTSKIVKICGLSTAPTLEAALAAGADRVGLVFFEKSPRRVSLETARALASQARGRAGVVALTVDADDETLAAIVAAVAPDALQLHGRESPARLADIKRRFALPLIKAIGISGAADLAAAADYAQTADRLLFDAKAPKDARLPGGNGVPFEWRLLADFKAPLPFWLSGGLEPSNVGEAIALCGAEGVDVSSGVESAPGVKDIAKIKRFIAEARAAFARRAAGPSLAPEAARGRVA